MDSRSTTIFYFNMLNLAVHVRTCIDPTGVSRAPVLSAGTPAYLVELFELLSI